MYFEPVWVSTIEHIGKFTKLGIEAKRHAAQWTEKTPHTRIGGWSVYLTNGVKYPSAALAEFPHYVHGSFPPWPAVMFASGRLDILDQETHFSSKRLVFPAGEIRKLHHIRFCFNGSDVLAVARYKSPMSFNRNFNINWVRIITRNVIVAERLGLRNLIVRKFGGKSRAESILGSDVLMCVGSTDSNMANITRYTDLLFAALSKYYSTEHEPTEAEDEQIQ